MQKVEVFFLPQRSAIISCCGHQLSLNAAMKLSSLSEVVSWPSNLFFFLSFFLQLFCRSIVAEEHRFPCRPIVHPTPGPTPMMDPPWRTCQRSSLIVDRLSLIFSSLLFLAIIISEQVVSGLAKCFLIVITTIAAAPKPKPKPKPKPRL